MTDDTISFVEDFIGKENLPNHYYLRGKWIKWDHDGHEVQIKEKLTGLKQAGLPCFCCCKTFGVLANCIIWPLDTKIQ